MVVIDWRGRLQRSRRRTVRFVISPGTGESLHSGRRRERRRIVDGLDHEKTWGLQMGEHGQSSRSRNQVGESRREWGEIESGKVKIENATGRTRLEQ